MTHTITRSLAIIALTAGAATAQDTATTIVRAGVILDGRGGRITEGAVVIRGDRVVDVLQGAQARAARAGAMVIDLGAATLMPGLIDVHVHINGYFNAAGKVHTRNDGDTPEQTTLAIAANLRRMLMSGVTTAQSMGAAEDGFFRAAVASGSIVGPRILSSLGPISNDRLSADSLRAIIRLRKAEGADAIKIFASRSIRDGGTTTMSAEQMTAMCAEAKSLGLRTLVHAHSAESMERAVLAGCTQIEHGIFATPEVLRLMAQHGTFYSPQCGLIFRNYLDNRPKFEGTGNFNEEGFAAMQRAIPVAAGIIGQAHNTAGLKLIWGTDAVAGAHGRETDDLICRVREGNQPSMAALRSATSGAAESMGLGKELGTIAKGYRADIIAVRGDPSTRIEALRDVVFVMSGGKVHRLEAPARAVNPQPFLTRIRQKLADRWMTADQRRRN
jgi:imidazolonepropionase-like amidohydrolase